MISLRKSDFWHRNKNHLRNFTFVVIAFLVLKLTWDVSRIPNYSGASAYGSLSPDGSYKGMVIILANESNSGGWSRFAMGMGGYDATTLLAMADAKSNQILAYVPVERNWISGGGSGIWTCGLNDKQACTSFVVGHDPEVQLPPSPWQRLVAKLVVYSKDLENPQLKQVREFR